MTDHSDALFETERRQTIIIIITTSVYFRRHDILNTITTTQIHAYHLLPATNEFKVNFITDYPITSTRLM